MLAEERLQADGDRVVPVAPPSRIIAKISSFHAVMNEKMLVATRPGSPGAEHLPEHPRSSRRRCRPPPRATSARRRRTSQHPDAERQREADVDDDQAEQLVVQAEARTCRNSGMSSASSGDHLHDEQHDQERGAALEPEPGHRDRRQQREHRARRARCRSPRWRCCAGRQIEATLGQHSVKVSKVKWVGNGTEPVVDLVVVLERGRDHPVHREDGAKIRSTTSARSCRAVAGDAGSRLSSLTSCRM